MRFSSELHSLCTMTKNLLERGAGVLANLVVFACPIFILTDGVNLGCAHRLHFVSTLQSYAVLILS